MDEMLAAVDAAFRDSLPVPRITYPATPPPGVTTTTYQAWNRTPSGKPMSAEAIGALLATLVDQGGATACAAVEAHPSKRDSNRVAYIVAGWR